MTMPAGSVQLSANTSDPEGDLLRHWWVVKSAPAGAKPVFDHQGLPVTHVGGLTLAGTYKFTLRAFDDLHITTKDVTVQVNPVTGTNNISTKNFGPAVYPNPFSEELNVLLSGNYDKAPVLIILNTSGQVVREQKVEGNDDKKIVLNLKSLHSGIYFLKVTGKGMTTTVIIIKQ